MTESQMTLGRDFRVGVDRLEIPEAWPLSEKIFDVRLFISADGTAWTRGGKVCRLPERIRAELPQGRSLDGGIFAGRRGFLTARAAVLHGHWTPACQFWAYDAPDAAGTWQDRIAEAGRIYPRVIGWRPFAGWRETNRWLAEIQADGGEGLVARHPTAMGYPVGRGDLLLKIKEPLR
jgi:hypothetical protein